MKPSPLQKDLKVMQIKQTKYGFSLELPLDFDKVLELTTSALNDQGFGILTEIDVKETLKNKLAVDFKRYKILDVCNPSLAHNALTIEVEIGLMFPFNVIVYETDECKSRVSVIDPYVAMNIFGNPELKPIAREVRKKLILSFLNLSATATESLGLENDITMKNSAKSRP